MLTNTMFSLTRFFTSRVASTAFRSANYVGLQRTPLSTSFRVFSVGHPTLLAPAVRKTTARRDTAKKSETKAKSKSRAKPKAKPKAKSKSTASTSKRRAKAKATTKAAAKPKKAAAKAKPSTRVPLKDRPPTKPVGAFFLYLRRAFSPTGSKSMAEAQAATRDAAATWRNMSDAEKQVFRDEAKVLLENYNVQRIKWYKDPKNAAVLRKLNKDRVKHGKQRIHAPSGIGPKKPLTPFFRYMRELRATDALSREKVPPNTAWVTWTAREAGTRWKMLSDAEKGKYTQAYHSEVDRSEP